MRLHTIARSGARSPLWTPHAIDGLAEASFYSILSTPSIIIEDEEEREVISWRGEVPSLQEVKQHLPPLTLSLSPSLGRGEG